ncbi:MAG: flagellar hook protein FlgE [Bacteriovoracaceae bacterium]
MGILRSMNIGISGLRASGGGMSVIGDNIANAATTGFKASRAEFQDVLATSLKGIDGGDQFGAGTKLSHIKVLYNQGDISRTDSSTDLAISGDGFFVVDADFGRGYTRDGSLHFDAQGNLVNPDGFRVMGFEADPESGKITNKMGAIKLGSTTIPAKSTKKVDVSMNLDSREPIRQFDINKPDDTSSYSNSVTVYDNVGTARVLTVYFNKTADNNWEYHVTAGSDDVDGVEKGQLTEMSSVNLIFTQEGLLEEEAVGSNSFSFNRGAKADQQIEFNFGETITEGGDGYKASTQYGTKSAIAKHFQDGYTAGALTSLSFNDSGILTAIYDNGEGRDISQIAVAKFENNEGLFKVGKNLLKESRSSGQAAVGKPSEQGRGNVLSKSIELSTTDIATEFVGLMTQQRNFQANAKAIQTADQMLNEVLNLKR